MDAVKRQSTVAILKRDVGLFLSWVSESQDDSRDCLDNQWLDRRDGNIWQLSSISEERERVQEFSVG